MKKFALVILLVLAFSLNAFAEGTPSKSTMDIAKVVKVEAVGGEGDIAMTVEVVEDAEVVLAKIEEIGAMIEEGAGVVECFDPKPVDEEEVEKVVEEALTEYFTAEDEMFDVSTLEMNEFVTVDVLNYDPTVESLVEYFDFITEYVPEQKMIAVLGLYDENEAVEWVLIDVEAVELDIDGETMDVVCIDFSQEVLAAMNEAADCSLAIVNAPAEEA